MANTKADFTIFFSTLTEAVLTKDNTKLREFFTNQTAEELWLEKWQTRIASETQSLTLMQKANPNFIPRNHRVAQVLSAAEENDLQPLLDLLKVISSPFEQHLDQQDFALPPLPDEEITQTFCGT